MQKDEDFYRKREKVSEIIAVLKERIKELEEIAGEDAQGLEEQKRASPKRCAASIEEIVVPPLEIITEKGKRETEEKKRKPKALQ